MSSVSSVSLGAAAASAGSASSLASTGAAAVAAAGLKRKREEDESDLTHPPVVTPPPVITRTYTEFCDVFTSEKGKGLTVLRCKPTFDKLFTHALQITAPAERDHAFSAMADCLSSNSSLGLRQVHGTVYDLWRNAVEASTWSKKTDYFVNSMIQGAQVIQALNPGRVKQLFDSALKDLRESDCDTTTKITACQRIIDACGENRTLCNTKKVATKYKANLQGVVMPVIPFRPDGHIARLQAQHAALQAQVAALDELDEPGRLWG